MTICGIGVVADRRPVFDGPQFDACRADFNPDRVATAIEFLSLCRATRTPTLNSYGLKHAAERWGRTHGTARSSGRGAILNFATST